MGIVLAMSKYKAEAKWFTARCKQIDMPYEEFKPLAQRVLGIDIPRGTYESMRYYLKYRTPEQMASMQTVAMSNLKKAG